MILGNYTYASGLEAMQKMLQRDDCPKAIFAGTDEMALGVIHAIQDAGYSVPNDFEVVGHDNTRLATMIRPKLTTVVQPMYDIGAVAMRLLTKILNAEEIEEKTSYFLTESSVVIRFAKINQKPPHPPHHVRERGGLFL